MPVMNPSAISHQPINSFFNEEACPLCGGKDAQVLRAATYPSGASLAMLQSAYSASSDSSLLDQVVECRGCRMVYISPRLDAQLIQSGYENVEDPVFVAQNPQRIKTFSRSVERLLKQTGLDPQGKRLLDVGCAGGAFPAAARQFGFEVAGVEPSQWLSAYARREYGLDVRQGILQAGMFPEHSFDVISLWDVIEHVPDPHAVFTLVRSLLKPDGYLWVNYPDIGSIAARLMGWKWPFWLSVHLHYYRRPTIAQQIGRGGFTVSFMQPHWQQLQFGYVMQRAKVIAPVLAPLETMVRWSGLGGLPFTYNMGQTMVVAKVTQTGA